MFQQIDVKADQSLFLDAGALLFDQSAVPPGRNLDLAKINAEGIVEAYNLLGYEAVGISRIDLAAGVDFLHELRKKSKFPWLSANLVDKKNKETLFSPFIIKKKAGLRIAIIGLTGSGAANEPQTSENYLILPWQDLLPRLMKGILPQTDLVILLSSLSPLENEQVSQEFPNVHIIIQAGMYSHNQNPALANNTLICQTEKQGKYIGQLHINWKKTGTWTDETTDPILLKRQELDRLTWQIKKLENAGDPQLVYKDSPATLESYYQLIERMKSVEKEIDAAQQNMKQRDNSGFSNSFIPIVPTVADDPAMEEIIKKTRAKINAFGRNVSSDGSLSDYVGSQACMKCHAEKGERWQATPHARAYETLVQKNQQSNIKCLPCHVTGVSILDQKQSPALTTVPESLHNVGCETCHGPGMAHSVNPEEAKLNDSPDAYLCLQCHSTEHDDAFNFEQDRKLVH